MKEYDNTMFTGLIEETGIIKRIKPIAGGLKLTIRASKIMDDLKIDDSIAVNGVCLTAVSVDAEEFSVDAVGETLKKSTIQSVRENEELNLERSVRLMDRLGGHLVQGHVNGIGTIAKIEKLGDNYFIEVLIPEHLNKYLIEEGSIAIDGISLTIATIKNSTIGISIIPHTWSKTILKNKKVGSKVNIETDVMAKFVEKLLSKDNVDGKFTENWFKQLGY
ncbi:MAG: riboflavin synthase [Ignavibacteria bacterium]|jgi:riboflavin synthase